MQELLLVLIKSIFNCIRLSSGKLHVIVFNCRNYTGPTSYQGGERSRLTGGGRGVYSPVIEIDDDSHSRFIGAEQARRMQDSAAAGDNEDNEWKRDTFCQPRNSLLSLTAEFVTKCSSKLAEINKKASQEKSLELLDNKCFMKLVDVAHSLLKMAPYDLECIKLEGLQKYMEQVFPLTDWSLETMRPSLTTIVRRLDKLFAKIQKSAKVYHSVDWDAAANLLKGVALTMWKHPYIVNVANLKSLIGTCQCLVAGEDSLTSMTDHHGPSQGKKWELPPESFCTVVYQLIALQVLILGNTFTLEQRLHLTEHPVGALSRFNFLSHDKGEAMMLNLLLPMCLKVGCGRKDAPKMRRVDVRFALNLLLSLLNPYYSKSGSHGSKDPRSAAAAGGGSAAVQYHPGGDVRAKIKSTSLEIAFLGLKILIVCFENQLNGEWFRIAKTIREMGNRGSGQISEGSSALWRFLDFVAMQRGAIYSLLLPFMHTRLQISADDNDMERKYQLATKDRITGVVIQSGRSRALLLKELGNELGEMKTALNKRLLESSSDSTAGGRGGSVNRRNTHRGSGHRTSFIEYVSEVYNNSRTSGGNLMEALSVRGQSISSGSVASGCSAAPPQVSVNLTRDLSVRSDNPRLAMGRHHTVKVTKTSRIIGKCVSLY